MKTVISNKSGKVLEIAKQALYTMQVLTAGLFIPLLFVFGISYNTPKPHKAVDEQKISTPYQPTGTGVITLDFNKSLSDKNS